jgi:hypothetical protein
MPEEGLAKPAGGGSNSAPGLGVEGRVHQTWKALPSRWNQGKTIEDWTW